MITNFKRSLFSALFQRVSEPRKFIILLTGPRQVGKTTLVSQVAVEFSGASHYATADEPALKTISWIEEQWNIGRAYAKKGEALIILDEIQKIPHWSDRIKYLWD